MFVSRNLFYSRFHPTGEDLLRNRYRAHKLFRFPVPFVSSVAFLWYFVYISSLIARLNRYNDCYSHVYKITSVLRDQTQSTHISVFHGWFHIKPCLFFLFCESLNVSDVYFFMCIFMFLWMRAFMYAYARAFMRGHMRDYVHAYISFSTCLLWCLFHL